MFPRPSPHLRPPLAKSHPKRGEHTPGAKRTPLPSRAPRDTKEELLDTAAELFFADGYHVGIDRIIAEAGIAKMTFYKHFASKTDLISAVISRAHGRVDARMRENATHPKHTPLKQAYSTIDSLCESMTDPACLGALVPRAVIELSDEEDLSRAMAIFCSWQIFCSIRRACMKAGIRQPLVSKQVYMIITGGLLLRQIFGDQPSLVAAKGAIRDIMTLARTAS